MAAAKNMQPAQVGRSVFANNQHVHAHIKIQVQDALHVEHLLHAHALEQQPMLNVVT
jgi:hypothetical protein